MRDIVTRYVAKPRTIFMAVALQDLHSLHSSVSMQVEPIDEDNLGGVASMCLRNNDQHFEKRSRSTVWHGFVATSQSGPLGVYWGFAPTERSMMHDSFLVRPNEALACGAFVRPDMRGRGIYHRLQWILHEYLLVELGVERVFTIVENTNQPSLRSNRRFGLEVYGVNWLIKLAGRNALSLVIPRRGRVRAHWVWRQG
jgi:RimJ/RimL family protein N-acetyltransferase